jgi:hypothetical protein
MKHIDFGRCSTLCIPDNTPTDDSDLKRANLIYDIASQRIGLEQSPTRPTIGPRDSLLIYRALTA